MLWYNEKNDGIVISTRIRLARNLKDTPFPMFMTRESKEKAADTLTSALVDGNSAIAKDFSVYKLDDMDNTKKLAMTESHLISPYMSDYKGGRALVSKDGTMSVMLMEEDHIRLQIIKGGYALDEAYDLASKVDDIIEENVSYAFDEKFGYLTSCPTNAGTGLRASLMLHLPALVMTGNIQRILSSVANSGIAVRGLYGEGSRSSGNMYQFSNQITMGLSEADIIAKLKSVTDKVIELEKKARDILMQKNEAAVSDKLWRSFGTLKYARAMSSEEAKGLLSDVMLGISMGIIDSPTNITELMIETEPANILVLAGEDLDTAARDKKRAEFIRGKLK